MRETSRARSRTCLTSGAGATVPCLAYHPKLDCLCCVNGDNFHTEGEPEVLDQVGAMITTRLKAKILPHGPKQEVVVERDPSLPAA